MTTSTLERIAADIDQLSLTDQLWLMERLAHRIREYALHTPKVHESDLTAMADDPDIQHALRQIDAEFAITEADR
jgi:hypothetical protein